MTDFETVPVGAMQRLRELEAHVERLREGLHQAMIHWGSNVDDEDGTAYAECEKRCDEAPACSLTHLKAEWQAEALEDVANYLQHGEGRDSVNPPVSIRGRAIRIRRSVEEPHQ